MATLGYGRLSLREDNRSFINNYMIQEQGISIQNISDKLRECQCTYYSHIYRNLVSTRCFLNNYEYTYTEYNHFIPEFIVSFDQLLRYDFLVEEVRLKEQYKCFTQELGEEYVIDSLILKTQKLSVTCQDIQPGVYLETLCDIGYIMLAHCASFLLHFLIEIDEMQLLRNQKLCLGSP